MLRIRVHPDDAEGVKASLIPQQEAALVEADTAVEVGGCIIDVEGGTIDLRLGVQLASIARAWLVEDERAENDVRVIGPPPAPFSSSQEARRDS